MARYTIWFQDGNSKPKAVKFNQDISQATSYITYERQALANGERFFTENQETSEVDMFFSADSVITPDKPMFVKNGKLAKIQPKPGSMNMKSSRTPNEMKWREERNKQYDRVQKKYPNELKPRQTKSRGKWIGNMFKSSNKRLQNITKTGTPKQKSLAKRILNSRRRN